MVKNTVWAVASTWRGLPAGVTLFADEESAWHHVDNLRQQMKTEDEVDVFEVAIPAEQASTTG